MIIVPSLPPALLKELETNFGTTVARAVWHKCVDHLNWFNACIPVGMIIFVHKNVTPGSASWPLPALHANWQFCDGSLIVNSDSPMVGQNVPDLRNRFIKSSATQGLIGGTEYMSLQHNHTGYTTQFDDADFTYPRSDTGTEELKYNRHSHPISNDLSTSYLKVPFYHEFQPYMRIA